MDFLTASNKKGLGDKVEMFDNGILNAEGKDIVVIGEKDIYEPLSRSVFYRKIKNSH